MSRPSLLLWAVVIAGGCGVMAAELRRHADIDALEARAVCAEAKLADGCFLTRSPRVVAEVRR